MARKCRFVSIVLFFLASRALPAAERPTNVYQGNGYSIRYPFGWHVLDAAKTAARSERARSMIGTDDGIGFDVEIFKGFCEENTAKLNVIRLEDKPLEEDERETLKCMPIKFAQAIGGHIEEITLRDLSVGNYPALEIRFDMTVAGKTVSFAHYAVSADGKRFMISCSAPKEQFRAAESAFRSMVSTFEPSFSAKIPRWMIVAFLGLGGGVAFVVALMKLAKPEPMTQTTQYY